MEGIKTIKRIFGAIAIIFVIIIVLIAITTGTVRNKVGKIEFDNTLNKSQLSINEELYNEVSDNITQEEFNSIVNVALFGIDDGRSDLIMIASVNQVKNKIKLITVPRDTLVNVEGYGNTVLNQAYLYGQEMLALKTLNSNFGLNISKYVTFDFKGFMNLINEVGGIKINITEQDMKYINENIHLISGENTTMLSKYGKVNLTGEQVLTFIRNRTVTKNSEIEARQKRVVMGILDKLSEKTFTEIWESSDYILEEMKTNLNQSDRILGEEIMSNSETYRKTAELLQVPSENIGIGQIVDGNYKFDCDLDAAKQEFKEVIYGK